MLLCLFVLGFFLLFLRGGGRAVISCTCGWPISYPEFSRSWAGGWSPGETRGYWNFACETLRSRQSQKNIFSNSPESLLATKEPEDSGYEIGGLSNFPFASCYSISCEKKSKTFIKFATCFMQKALKLIN